MKDSYSFDRDEAGVDVSFQKHARAYERIFERCGLESYAVQAESGMMGGSESIDYLAPSGSGENTLVTCANGDYAPNSRLHTACRARRHSRSGSKAGRGRDVRGSRRSRNWPGSSASIRRRHRKRCR